MFTRTRMPAPLHCPVPCTGGPTRPAARTVNVSALAVMLGAAAFCGDVFAQQRKPGDVTGDAHLTGIAVLDTGIDGGGDFHWEGFVASGGLTWQLSRELSAGVSLRYGYEHWSFSTPNAFGGAAPWTNLNSPRVGLNFGYQAAPDLTLFVAPQIEWSYESGASASDGQSYGGVVGITKVFSPQLVLGLGAGIYRQIDENKVFPFVIVNWQLDDKWRVRNSLPAGPAGGAGLELAYAIDANWEIAGGGAYREYRFRLRDDGPVSGGIGENRGIPLFARLTRKLGPQGRIDFVAGAIVGGRLEVTNASGNATTSSDYKTAPLLGLTAAFDF